MKKPKIIWKQHPRFSNCYYGYLCGIQFFMIDRTKENFIAHYWIGKKHGMLKGVADTAEKMMNIAREFLADFLNSIEYEKN